MKEFIMTLPDIDLDMNSNSDDDSDALQMTIHTKQSKNKKNKKKKKSNNNNINNNNNDNMILFDGLVNDDDDDSLFNEDNKYSGEVEETSEIMKKVQKHMAEKNMNMNNDSSDDDDVSDMENTDDDVDDDNNNNDDDNVRNKNDKNNNNNIKQQKQKKQKKNNNNNNNKVEKIIATNSALNKVQYFSQMHLSKPLSKAIEKLGFKKPTPVQSLAIPYALNGSDVLVSAVTGSGKTAAFLLPILERLLYRSRRISLTRVLILAPTRELAAQCQEMGKNLCCFTDIRIGLLVGGLSFQSQQTMLNSRPDIIIATPGRLIDHLRNTKSFDLQDIEILILDEADRLLDKGFADELKEIIKLCPRQRQSMLFSATLTDKVTELINLSLNNPKRIVIDPSDAMVSSLLQEFIRIRQHKENDREAIILALCKRTFHEKTIIFFRSKTEAHRMMIIFGFLGLNASELHGNLTQLQRLTALEKFRDGKVNYLLCTDLAARGLDIKGVETVINTHLPYDIRQYIHRVGRTARAGKKGRSITLAGHNERSMIKKIIQLAKKSNAEELVKSRSIPSKIINKYSEKIKNLEDDIRDIIKEERIEKEIRIAEMEANKAQNLYMNQEEILSRPAKTWFQSKKDKNEAKKISLMEYQGKSDEINKIIDKKINNNQKEKRKIKKDPLKGLSRRKKRQKLMKMEMEREAKERKKQLKQGEAVENLPFTQQQKTERGIRKKKSLINKNQNNYDDDDHDHNYNADDNDYNNNNNNNVNNKKRSRLRYEWKSNKTDFDQRYGKTVDKIIQRSNIKPKKKKSKTSKAKHRRRKGSKR